MAAANVAAEEQVAGTRGHSATEDARPASGRALSLRAGRNGNEVRGPRAVCGRGRVGTAPGPAPPRRLVGCTAGRASGRPASRPLLHMLRVP